MNTAPQYALTGHEIPERGVSLARFTNRALPYRKQVQRRKCRRYQFGKVPVPPVHAWPRLAMARYNRAVLLALGREQGPLEIIVFRFDAEHCVFMMSNAFAILSFCDLRPECWGTAGGYPSYCVSETEALRNAEELAGLGYIIVFIGQEQLVPTPEISKSVRAKVVDIASARTQKELF